MGSIDRQFWLQRRLIGIVDAGEALQLAGAGFLVQPFGIPLLAGLDRRVDEHFDERQLGLDVQSTNLIAVGPVRTDKAGHGQNAAIGEQLGYFADAANVLFTVGGRETEILVESVADVIAVEDIGKPATL